MSRLSGRVNRLKTATHDFYPYGVLYMVRRYYTELLKTCEKSPRFEDRLEEAKLLRARLKKRFDLNTGVRLHELEREERGVFYKYMQEVMVAECERYPNGYWLPKEYGAPFRQMVEEAKAHFGIGQDSP